MYCNFQGGGVKEIIDKPHTIRITGRPWRIMLKNCLCSKALKRFNYASKVMLIMLAYNIIHEQLSKHGRLLSRGCSPFQTATSVLELH